MTYQVSRSRKICGDYCQRKRYWNYEHNGTGIVGPGANLRAARGIAAHAILEAAQRGEDLQKATEAAKAQFVEDMTSLEALQAWEYDRAKTMREQLFFLDLASKTLIPRVADKLREDHNLILVEGVHTVPLVEGVVDWYSREDALMQDKKDQSRWLFSFKTVENFQPWKHLDGAKYALQNTTEPWAAMKDGYENIKGVAMLWLEVGVSKMNKDAGCYEIDSSLVRPWYDKESKRFYWKWRSNGKQVPKGATKVSVCDMMPVEQWVDLLQSGGVIPGDEDPFADRFYGPVRYFYPDEKRVNRKIRELAYTQQARAEAAFRTKAALDSGDIEDWQDKLDTMWPQNEMSCTRCAYTSLCWGGDIALTQIGKYFRTREKRVQVNETLVEED